MGFDRKFERDMAAFQSEMEELTNQKKQMEISLPELQARLTDAEGRLAKATHEQKSYLTQKNQFEEQLRGEGPNPVNGEEEKLMLEEMIAELDEKDKELNDRTSGMKKSVDQIRMNITTLENSLKTLEQLMEENQEKTKLLEEAAKVDPGIPVIRVEGNIYGKTKIITPHKEMNLDEDMQKVRIAEAKEDPNTNKYQIKISNLR